MRAIFVRAGAALTAALVLLAAGCASVDDVMVNKEAGFHYGYGSGPTEAAAVEQAYDDLIINVLVETGSMKATKKTAVTPEMRNAFAPLKLKPYNLEQNKTDKTFAAVFRIATKDWAAIEQKRLAALATDLGGQFSALKADAAKPSVEQLRAASALLATMDRNGVGLKLDDAPASRSLLRPQVEAFCRTIVQGLSWNLVPDSGVLTAGSAVRLTAFDRDGKPFAGLPLVAVWTAGAAPVPLAPFATDARGQAAIKAPADPALRNQRLSLKIQTAFAGLGGDTVLMAEFDAVNTKSYAFRQADAVGPAPSDLVKVAGGSFTIGKQPHDATFGVATKEKPRDVTVKPFAISRTPVTNAEYRVFLDATRVPKSDWPDYLDNEDFNAPAQPVVGVSRDDARKYAAWLSGVLGATFRLPTEEEYEVAARAGRPVIYPWGDQKPADGVRANYNGNGRFSGTSPVGSFENGLNPLGLADMVGNVWQWTDSSQDGKAVAKGGSYLDGQGELRISNRRFEDPSAGFADIGFRLVKETVNEN